RVHDDDAAAGGGGDVDVVHANSGTHDRAQLARVFQKVGGETGAAADDDAVRRLQGFAEGRTGPAGTLLPLQAGPAGKVEAGGFKFVANEDTGHAASNKWATDQWTGYSSQ